MPNNPNAAKNLIPFVKGDPRRINRPKGIPNTKTRLKRLLEYEQEITNPASGNKEMFTVAEQMDLAMINQARKGNVKAYSALVDRLEGKAAQSVDVTSNGETLSNIVYMPIKKSEKYDADNLET